MADTELLRPTVEAAPKRTKRDAKKADELTGTDLSWLGGVLADTGMTRTKFAELAGMSASHLRNIETGHRTATPEQIEAIRQAAAGLNPTQPRLF